MSDQRDRNFVQHSIDTGLESMQGNPFLAQRIMNQERTEQPVMKKKISFAFILAMVLLIVCVATAVAGAVNEDFNDWLYRLWPEAAMKLMPIDVSCEKEGIKMSLINAVAEDNEVYLTFSMQDLEGDRINAYSNLYMDIRCDLVGDDILDMSNYRYDLLDDYEKEHDLIGIADCSGRILGIVAQHQGVHVIEKDVQEKLQKHRSRDHEQ